jgi:hypothetical protein
MEEIGENGGKMGIGRRVADVWQTMEREDSRLMSVKGRERVKM